MEVNLMGVGKNIVGTAPGLETEAALERSALGKAIGAANTWHAIAEKQAARVAELEGAQYVRRLAWFCFGALVSLVACGAIAWLR